MKDKLLSASEIAGHLGIKKSTVYDWVRKRNMPVHRVGRSLKFQIKEVDAWIYCYFWSAPTYNPVEWNDGLPDANDCTGHISTEVRKQYKNNCYNYACNVATDSFAQPGRSHGSSLSIPLTCNVLNICATSDGLKEAKNCDTDPPHCYHKVALAIAPDLDYHWYRQDDNGNWSHKPGMHAITNLDNSGLPITDPRFADRGPYTIFCGCFWVCKNEIKIK